MQRAKLTEISPLTRVDEIEKPMFVITGANDPRVPKSEADQMVAAIRANGGEAWHLIAADEGHGFRKKDNSDYAFLSQLMFWEKAPAREMITRLRRGAGVLPPPRLVTPLPRHEQVIVVVSGHDIAGDPCVGQRTRNGSVSPPPSSAECTIRVIGRRVAPRACRRRSQSCLVLADDGGSIGWRRAFDRHEIPWPRGTAPGPFPPASPKSWLTGGCVITGVLRRSYRRQSRPAARARKPRRSPPSALRSSASN